MTARLRTIPSIMAPTNYSPNSNHCYPMKTHEELPVILVPTSKTYTTAKKRINTTNLRSSDLESLKKNDPFLYYSIPGVRDAECFHSDVGPSSIGSARRRNRINIQGHKEDPSSQVTRQTRISVECHSGLIMMEMLKELQTYNEEQETGTDFEVLFSSYMKNAGGQ